MICCLQRIVRRAETCSCLGRKQAKRLGLRLMVVVGIEGCQNGAEVSLKMAYRDGVVTRLLKENQEFYLCVVSRYGRQQ